MKGDVFFESISNRSQFSKMHPKVGAFFKGYLANEKAIKFNDRWVLNTHFPPYPSRAFDNLIKHFNLIGKVTERHLFSVTLAVTNRCNYRCWHCYNAGRAQQDISLSTLKEIATKLQDLGVVHVTITGGEPLLRKDLEEIVSSFDDRTYLTLNTTGDGLTNGRARALRDSGIFAVGVSLDSTDPREHDRLRGKKGAFDTSIETLQLASQNDLYPYIIAVATHDFLIPDKFRAFMQFASKVGALEVHLLEPSLTGRLAGRSEVLLKQAERELILNYQKEIAQDDELPILSSFLYLESPDAFGCGAGLTHLYIDGSGEVCPCNLVPLSFGNITNEPFHRVLDRMGQHFRKPRSNCVAQMLSKHIHDKKLPVGPEGSIQICNSYLPKEHSIPRFFQVRSEAKGEVGQKELQSAYNQIHEYYDEFWIKEAGKPIMELIDRLIFSGAESVIEVGCGTGVATVLIADMLNDSAEFTAVDISEGMLLEAHKRARSKNIENIRFVSGEGLELLGTLGLFDLIFSSWTLGYIPLKPFFMKAYNALRDGGRLAFIVHKEDSPYKQLKIFRKLISKNPSILKKRVAFDFPRDMDYVRDELEAVELEVEHLVEGEVVFRYDGPEEVLEHLLKSGAGTVYYDALEASKKKSFEGEFIKNLVDRHKDNTRYEVVHDYISCIAKKTERINGT